MTTTPTPTYEIGLYTIEENGLVVLESTSLYDADYEESEVCKKTL